MSNPRTERWRQLLSPHRVGDKKDRPPQQESLDERTAYDVDYDRIVFSSAFRSLHDKTQVFPLSSSDYTRTRLTHSIEASSVGRSLGQLAGRSLKRQGVEVEPSHLGTLVAAACLAHDIGNPPFGHSGEAAIQHWVEKHFQHFEHVEKRDKQHPFATESEWKDLESFEGNAQGFRILTRLQARNRDGGLRYTVATVGAMSKYPCPSVLPGRRERKKGGPISEKKFGFFQEDAQLAREVFRTLGLKEREADVFSRHPLAFLVEAADDICYALIDLEDSAKLGLIPMEEACSLLESVAAMQLGFHPLKEKVDWESRLGRARAGAIFALIHECVAGFEENVRDMEEGRFEQSLMSARPEADRKVKDITGITRKKGYESERVLQIEAAGFRTLGGLLDMFALAVLADKPDREEKKLRQLLPLEFFQRPGPYLEDRDEAILRLTPYQRLLCVTDYVSGMTDGFAVELYQRLSGIKLPE
ncbi:dGTP triphosphohydrolase [Vitiosangium sp. GDMCC 1.1324]|uniref:dGTP triphosphohydrolase n=1 Tax=Vitiosangium sp. (strain GDMCC 1.1324) TaxID=2138576 RepID=UPI000D347C2A|nr:dNTP triphosphohydrolase [Vitiosangium sp. GDMCC 1.1324]PTL76774.1 deoxyguanosinetriphosphate triphosphohydrolase [Vitiosangium sp. GDMCC 1.1324]